MTPGESHSKSDLLFPQLEGLRLALAKQWSNCAQHSPKHSPGEFSRPEAPLVLLPCLSQRPLLLLTLPITEVPSLLTLPITQAPPILTVPITETPPLLVLLSSSQRFLPSCTASQNSSDSDVVHIKISSVLFLI